MAMSSMWARLSQGERLAFAGAAALLVVGQWLFGDLLAFGGVPIALEIAAAELMLLLAVRAVRPATMWPIPYAVLLAGIATVIVVPTISDVLATIHNVGTLDGETLLAGLVDWLSAAAIAAGAWMVWRES
jgi:hypothetical protein